MRYAARLVPIGLGAFLLVAGGLLRFYVAPRMIQAPTDVYQVTKMRADNATYFNPGTLSLRTGATITATTTVRGDPRASHGRVAVWDAFTATQDVPHHTPLSYMQSRVAFDRRTGDLRRCCGAAVDGDKGAPMSGIGMFWPVTIAKRTYMVFDFATKRAWPASYDGEDVVDGVRAYRFVQHIPDTTLPVHTPDMPGSMLGRSKTSAAVPVDRHYQGDSTYWVNPDTGAVVDVRQRSVTTLVAKHGPGGLVVADLDLRMTPRSRAATLATVRTGQRSLWTLTSALPAGSGAAGLALLIPGILWRRRPSNGRAVSTNSG